MAFTFTAKAGKEDEFEKLLNNPESGLRIAKALGATRNTLLFGDNNDRRRMVRIFEFPDGANPKTLTDLARDEPKVKEFLRTLSAVIEDSFDVDNLDSLDRFNERVSLRLAYDVRT